MILAPIKSVLRATPLYAAFQAWRERRQLTRWKRAGYPVPPPQAYKYGVIREYGKKHGLRVMVETGTFLGDAVEACRDHFERIYSIELGEDLHRRAVERFLKWKHIDLIQGDSGGVLPDLLMKIGEPALFWLDGHYSSGITAQGKQDTPILSELEAVLAHTVKGHVLLIDDARCFTGECGYPTIKQTQSFILQRNPSTQFQVDHDIMRVCLPTEG